MVILKFGVEWAQMAKVNKQAQCLTVKQESAVIQICMIKAYIVMYELIGNSYCVLEVVLE